MSESKTTFRCGWCGMDFPTHFACGNHEQNCEVMQEEANKEVLKQDWRRYEEQEHEAGRI